MSLDSNHILLHEGFAQNKPLFITDYERNSFRICRSFYGGRSKMGTNVHYNLILSSQL